LPDSTSRAAVHAGGGSGISGADVWRGFAVALVVLLVIAFGWVWLTGPPAGL
jgi:hypothetical protein